jgi:hypothetical protein
MFSSTIPKYKCTGLLITDKGHYIFVLPSVEETAKFKINICPGAALSPKLA